MLDGDLWPRWDPHIGPGTPLLQLYPPAAWLLSWPALALGGAPEDGLRLALGRAPGPRLIQGDHTVSLSLPARKLLRVENARFPPAGFEARVALAHPLFIEYLNPHLGRDYGLHYRPAPDDTALSELLSVSWRFIPGQPTPQVLRPNTFATVVTADAASAARWDRGPEWMAVELPAGHPEGTLRLSEQWFPGWRYRVDGGRGATRRRGRC